MLGHADIATTQIYTKVELSHLLEQHALYHPRSRIARGKAKKDAGDGHGGR
jgi:integrase/recombinase XerD